jgi:hypothetical protein
MMGRGKKRRGEVRGCLQDWAARGLAFLARERAWGKHHAKCDMEARGKGGLTAIWHRPASGVDCPHVTGSAIHTPPYPPCMRISDACHPLYWGKASGLQSGRGAGRVFVQSPRPSALIPEEPKRRRLWQLACSHGTELCHGELGRLSLPAACRGRSHVLYIYGCTPRPGATLITGFARIPRQLRHINSYRKREPSASASLGIWLHRETSFCP